MYTVNFWLQTLGLYNLVRCFERVYRQYTARKIGFPQFYSVYVWCKKVQTRGKLKAKMVNTSLACQFIWGVNFRANAVFTIFALYLTLVYTFLHLICNFSCSDRRWGGEFVAGYNKTKKNVSKQDKLQCWSKYFLNYNAFLSFQNLVKSLIHFNST